MDDRRFDALAKSLARGTNRRTLLKGLLGLGGAVAAGGSLLENDAQAARRPIPTPRPPTCPGQQVPCGSGCCCPLGQERCGPDCCTEDNVPAPETGHSECCDNACCFGTCYGEEFCCPTNNRSGGEFPVPPTHKICNTANGTECCEFDQECCAVNGCCDTVCTEDGHCCAPADVCSGGGESPDLCCVNDLTTSSVCCGGGTNDNACFEAVAGVCCTDSDCIHPCDVCNLETHLCVSSCDNDTQVCCSYPDGTDQCVTGECCIGGEPGCEDSICCLREGRNICTFGVTCGCGCENEADCCFINDVFVGCVDLTQEGACCTDADCGDPCLSCNLETGTCGPSCDTETQICCTEQAGPGVCVTGACCPGGLGCDASQNCCVGAEGVGSYCTEAPCECDRVCSDAGLDCCTINGEFAGCYDQSAAGTCCTAGQCEYLNEFDDCLVGACTDFACEQLSSCTAGQNCCSGECSDLECE